MKINEIESKVGKKMNEEKGFQKTNINWYPGHMVKAINEIKKNLKYIDLVLVVLDARIPFASLNKDIYEIVKQKTVIMLFNKADLADPVKLKKAEDKYKQEGCYTVRTNALSGEGIKETIELIKNLGSKIKYKNKTSTSYKIVKNVYRVLVVGVPNCGKSSILNKIANKKSAEVGNKPGVTKQKQWIRVDKQIEIMDTPGILAPKLLGEQTGEKLALCGNIKEEILDLQELSIDLIEMLKSAPLYLSMLKDRYKIEEDIEKMTNVEILELVGKKRGAIIKGGEIDYEKTARILIEDYRSGKIGRISLE